MRKRENLFFIFFLFLFLAVTLFGLGSLGALFDAQSLIEKITIPSQRIVFGFFNRLPFTSSFQCFKLEKEKEELLKKLVDQKNLEKENQALKDQFQVVYPKPLTLMPAGIIGAPGFLPQVSEPEVLVLDKGENNGVYVGQAVVFKDNLIGRILRVSAYLSAVDLLGNEATPFAVKTLSTQALGVAKGEGGEIILDNVLLSEELREGDFVLTKGDLDEKGRGVPANLIVGKIISIEKKPSALFQKASLKSFVDFAKTSTVFLVMP